jgi:hypothetical protein
MTRREALTALAWIAAFVVVGSGVLAVLVGRAAAERLDAAEVDPARGRSTQESAELLAERVSAVDGVASASPGAGGVVAELDGPADRDETSAGGAAVCRAGSDLYARSGLQPTEPGCLVRQGAAAEWVTTGS